MKISLSNTKEESILFLRTTGEAVVTKLSPFSGKCHTSTLSLTDDQYSRWLGGELIQYALPHLNDDEREFLISGITPEEWNEEFGKDED